MPRGGARDALIAAAAELLSDATLDDLTAFITVSRLKERTGLSSGAIYSAFSPTSGVGDRTRSAPQVVARRALFEPLGTASETVRRTIAAVEAALDEIAARDADLVAHEVARLFTMAGMEGARGELAPEYNTAWLMATVSLTDEEAAEHLLANYRGFREVYSVLVRRLLAMTDREPLPGIALGQLSSMLTTVLDGAVMRVRFDPDCDERFLEHLVLGAWSGLTRSVGDVDDTLVTRVAVPTDRPFPAEEDRAVRAAVRRVADRAGWGAVTVDQVAHLAGIDPARVSARYRDRHRMAVLPWEELVDGIERRALLRRGGSELADRVRYLVEDLADVACSNRALTGSLLRVWVEGADRLDDDAAPVAVVRLRDLLAAELGDSGMPAATARDRAEVAVDGVLLAAATSTATAAAVASTVLAGVVPDDG